MSKATPPATKKRGADPQVPGEASHKDAEERKLDQGLEESMAGSDPPSITQPVGGSDERSVQNTTQSTQKPLGSSHTDQVNLSKPAIDAKRKSK